MRKTLLTLTALCATLLAPLSLQTALAQTAPAAAARVIVKYKADSSLMRKQAQSAGGSAAFAQTFQAEVLGQRLGLALRNGAAVAERTQVVFASGMSSAQLAQRLSAESDIEYAVPDERRHRAAAPNDTLYGAGVGGDGPAVGQWYLRAPSASVKSSINAESAWGVTTGSADVIVAVLDSGVRFEHPDLLKLASGGNLLDGYDMISEDHDSSNRPLGSFASANDGNGRDADASDPGDWVTQAEANSGPLAGCRVEGSSWHGTQTAALIGALTNNGSGMASVGRRVRVLPVRVLGKCGGFDSDIIAGMRWAAGLDIAGVPHNNNPAWVINMSLGGAGACSAAYSDAVAAVNAAGTVVVASSGNSEGHAVSTPADCPGVIAVSGLRHVGTKVGFSDIGPEISISAPGGNCVNDVGACLYPILTASNTGTTGPSGSTYTTSFGVPSLGTSFSAPLVAGTVALMLSADSTLSTTQVRALLQSTARPFPTSGATNNDGSPVLQCTAPQVNVNQDQCYCTTSTCGAGMLDAGAALQSVLNTRVGVVANISISTANPAIGKPVELSAVNTALSAGGTGITSYLWQIVDGGGIVTSFSSATNASTATLTPSAGGWFDVSLTVQDNRGNKSTSIASVYVPGAPPPSQPPPSSDSGGGGALGAGWLALLLIAVLALRNKPYRA